VGLVSLVSKDFTIRSAVGRADFDAYFINSLSMRPGRNGSGGDTVLKCSGPSLRLELGARPFV